MKKIIILVSLLILISCNKEKKFDGPDQYADGFETYTTLADLLPEGNDDFWSFTQLTIPGNTITVDPSFSHSGSQSLRFNGLGTSNDVLSKCSISKQNMAFWEKETVRVSGWYYLQGTAPLDWLFLMDLEEQAAIGAGPGMRLVLVDNKIRVEHKFLQDDIVQETATEIEFPRNQWVELVWEVKLSRKKKGSLKVWQNGVLIISSTDRKTLPKDLLYSQQGTLGRYSSIEIGITANATNESVVMWVDDFSIRKL